MGSEILGIVAYDSIMTFGKDNTFQVNTTSITVQEIVKKIDDIIHGNSKGDTIDWLTEISEKNDLKKFFPD